MNRIKAAIVTVLMMSLTAFQAQAQENGINGLLVGAGSGALVGQAIGRDTKGTLIGTAVGGVLGLIVGSEMENTHSGRAYGSPQPAVFLPSPPPPVVFTHSSHSNFRNDYRPHFRPAERCREIVTYERRHGHSWKVIKTVCREERGNWRGDHRDRWRGDHRDHWRGNYSHRDRW